MSSLDASVTSRRSWRQTKQAPATPEVRKTQRALIVLCGLLLFGALILLLAYWLWPSARLRVVGLSAGDYDVFEAPPIAFYREDIAALQDLETTRTKTNLPWENLVASRLNSLQSDLASLVRPEENLLVYISAHGVHGPYESDGAQQPSERFGGYLLFSDFDHRAGRGRYPIANLLDSVRGAKAAFKLLVLDSGRLLSEPRKGIVVNEFPRLLEKAVAELNDPTVWVLNSNDLFEASYYSPKDKRSVFGYFLAEGLKGGADGFGGRTTDQRVDLDELVGYVQQHVSQYVWTAGGQNATQTPILMRGGQGRVGAESGEGIFLTVARQAAPAEPSRNVSATGALLLMPPLRTFSPLIAQTTAGPTNADATAPQAAASATKPKVVVPQAIPTATGAPASQPTANGTVPKSSASPTASATAIAAITPSAAQEDTVATLLSKSWEYAAKARPVKSANLQTPWTPVDYAPHLWRRYLALLRGYQWRTSVGLRTGEGRVFESAENELRRRIQAAEVDYRRSAAYYVYEAKESGLRDAIRLRNSAVFLACELMQGENPLDDSQLSQFASRVVSATELEVFLERLANMESCFETPLMLVSTGADEARLLQWKQNELEVRRSRLAESYDSILDKLKAATGELPRDIPKLSESSTAVLPTSVAESALKSAQERAHFECLLAATSHNQKVSQAFAARAKELAGSHASDTAKSLEMLRRCGAELNAFYAGLPGVVQQELSDNDPISWLAAEWKIRTAEANDDLQQERLSGVGGAASNRHWPFTELQLWPIKGRLNLSGPILADGKTPGRISLEPKKVMTLAWQLESSRELPAGLEYELEFDERSFAVEIDKLPVLNGRRMSFQRSGANTAKVHVGVSPRREQATGEPDLPFTLHVFAKDESRIASSSASFRLPSAIDLELIAEDTMVRNQDGSSVPPLPIQMRRLPSGETVKSIRLRPLPLGKGRTTAFVLNLREASGRGQSDVQFTLLSVPEDLPLERRNRSPGPWWNDADESLPSSRGWQPIISTKLQLPADGKRIPLPTKSSDAAAAPPPNAAPPTPSNTAFTSIPVTAGMVVVLDWLNLSGGKQRECIWLDVDVRHPSSYLDVQVESDPEKRGINVKVTAKEEIEVPAETGFTVGLQWSSSPTSVAAARRSAKPDLREIKRESLTRSAAYTIPTYPELDELVDLEIGVDGYPRAFLFQEIRTAVKRNYQRTLTPRECVRMTASGFPRSLTLAEITKDEPLSASYFDETTGLTSFAETKKLLIDLRADAEATQPYEIELELKQGATSIERLPFDQDRQIQTALVPLAKDGEFRFESTVEDRRILLTPPSGDFEIQARLKRGSTLLGSEERRFRIDTQAPRLSSLQGPRLNVVQQAELKLDVEALDDCGVRRVQMLFTDDDKSDSKAAVNAQPAAGGSTYSFTFSTKEKQPGTGHWVLVWATDNVGNVNPLPIPIKVTILSPPPGMLSTEGGAPVKNGDLTGHVRQGNSGRPLDLTLTGGDSGPQTRKAGEDGFFAFRDLKPGNYQISGRGFIAGSIFSVPPQEVVIAPGEKKHLELQVK